MRLKELDATWDIVQKVAHTSDLGDHGIRIRRGSMQPLDLSGSDSLVVIGEISLLFLWLLGKVSVGASSSTRASAATASPHSASGRRVAVATAEAVSQTSLPQQITSNVCVRLSWTRNSTARLP